MVTYSLYPFDPRPRRAIDALVREGATIDLICLGDASAPKREALNGIEVFRVQLKHERGGKIGYAYRYAAFILISSLIFARRCLARRYDLIYVHNMPDILVLSALLPKLLGAKVVLDLHDPMPELMMTIFEVTAEPGSRLAATRPRRMPRTLTSPSWLPRMKSDSSVGCGCCSPDPCVSKGSPTQRPG